MSRRLLLVSAAAFSLTFASPIVRPAVAQDVPPEVQNSKNAAIGEISGDAVYVRSGAGDNYYPTMKLSAPARVTVVGEKFDWLKIVPPEGSFCYVAKAFVDSEGGDTGKVNREDVNVRAGSALNAMKTTVQAKLAMGQQVKILGEQDEYYKIAPPADAFVFVKKEFVKPVAAVPQVAHGGAATPIAPTDAAPPITPNDPATGLAEGTATGIGSGDLPRDPSSLTTPNGASAAAPSTQPAGDGVLLAAATTQPSVETQFDKLEADFATASNLTIENQPVAELLGGYQKLAANPQLPESMRRIADFRVNTLKARADAREQFLAVMKQQEEAKKRTQTLKAEQEEIAQQIKKVEIKMYTAVGELRTSSLQLGQQMTYRLTDPATGRTVCYLKSDDQKVAGMIGQFIGVTGNLSTDPGLNLKTVAAEEAEQVDPNQLYRQIAAQIVPPSLIPQDAQAASSTGQE